MLYVNADEMQTGAALAGSSLPPSVLECLQHIPSHTQIPTTKERQAGNRGPKYLIWHEVGAPLQFPALGPSFRFLKQCQLPGPARWSWNTACHSIYHQCPFQFYNQYPFPFSECHYERSHDALGWILLSKWNEHSLKGSLPLFSMCF